MASMNNKAVFKETKAILYGTKFAIPVMSTTFQVIYQFFPLF